MGGGCFGYEKGIRYSQIGDILRDLAGLSICEVFLFLFDNSYLFAGIYTKAVYRAENKNFFAFWGGNMHKR